MAQKRERVSVVCVHDHKILCFVAIDPTSGRRYYFLPGGALEAGESETECGARETLEETSYKVIVESESRLTKHYSFLWNGDHFDCTTHFYRGHLAEPYRPPLAVEDQDYNKGAVWMPVSKIHVIFDDTPEIHDAVVALVES